MVPDVPMIDRYEDVAAWADVFVGCNTSALFELAACGVPVVLLHPPWYRDDVEHGGRFYDWARVGPVVRDPDDLARMIGLSLDWPEREHIARAVFPLVEGSAQRAADAIMSAVGGER